MADKIEVPKIEYSVLRKFADDKRCNFKELCDAVREAVESPLRLRAELLREADDEQAQPHPLSELLADQRPPDDDLRRAADAALRDMYDEAAQPKYDITTSAHSEARRTDERLARLRKDVDEAYKLARARHHAEGSMHHNGRKIAYLKCLTWIDAALAAERGVRNEPASEN